MSAQPRIAQTVSPAPRRRRAALVAVLALTLAGRPARAGGPIDAQLEAASRAYQALDYEQAIATAAPIAARTDARVAQRIDAQLVIALAQLALVDPGDPGGADSARHQDAAEAALGAILALQWDFELDRGYPAAAQAAFAAARDRFERARATAALARCAAPPSLALEAPPHPRGGRALDVTLRLTDPRGCARVVRLTWARDRVTTSSLNRVLLPVVDGAVTWRVPAEVTTSTTGVRLSLYAEAYDRDHGRLATLGSFEQPRALAIAAGAPPPPLYRRWWFWTALGAVAIGTGVLIDQARSPGPSTIVIHR
ncbi:MAG: hypothetical protein K8W52_35940 [Deltaproteobacteria bacterium]|nr:hypothetical protein [Deltaproteobacteria bacterium]